MSEVAESSDTANSSSNVGCQNTRRRWVITYSMSEPVAPLRADYMAMNVPKPTESRGLLVRGTYGVVLFNSKVDGLALKAVSIGVSHALKR